MTTWQTIFGVDPPVKGVPSQFSGARDAFERMRSDAQSVVDQFRNFGDPSFVEGNLNDAPGAMVTQLLQNTDDGLDDLPRIAREAHGFFSDHYDRLVELREAADEALGRARTAWDRKNQLEGQRNQLQSQIDGLQTQIDDAPDDEDTSGLDGDLSGAQTSLGSVDGELGTLQRTLDKIYGDSDSEYNDLVNAEHTRNRETVDGLNGIDLGSLEDPGFWDKVGDFLEGVAGFLGGILESVANLFEALVTGDWATFFWELKKLVDVFLLVVGTIALFTGVGTVLGAMLIAAAVASFALNTGLYLTQTPDPQTGQTVGLTDVIVSGIGAAFAGVSAIQTLRKVTALNEAAGSMMPAANNTFRSVFAADNAVGVSNGALTQFLTNAGGNARNGFNAFYNRFHADPTLPPFPVSSTWSAERGVVPLLPAPINAGVPASWEIVGTVAPLPGSQATLGERFASKFQVFSWDGFSSSTGGWGGDGPLIGAPSRFQVMNVAQQIRQSPDVRIVPASP